MYQKWNSYTVNKKKNLNIYSDEQVDQFKKKYFKNDGYIELKKDQVKMGVNFVQISNDPIYTHIHTINKRTSINAMTE